MKRTATQTKTGLIFVALAALGLTATACNIPVFRYALERWRPDSLQLVLVHRGELTEGQRQQLRQLEQASTLSGGPANVEIRRLDLDVPAGREDRSVTDFKTEVLKSLSKVTTADSESASPKLPSLLVRTNHARGVFNGWQGSLDEAVDQLLDSPVRKQLRERLLSGHAVVWLILKSPQSSKNKQLCDLLTEQFDLLSHKLKLPEGIGLPGSELHSDVPLFLKFSWLELNADDPREQFLVKLFQGFQPQAVAEGQPLAVPVFGRGRALEVIPAETLDAKLVEELTLFLCGACSCQVKESNPGFDLLLSAAWDRELFGEGGILPPPPKTVADGQSAPRIVPIPPGRKK